MPAPNRHAAAPHSAAQRRAVPAPHPQPAVLSHAMPMLCRAGAQQRRPTPCLPRAASAARRFSLTPCRCSAEPERSSAAQCHAVPRAPHPQPGGSLSRHADALPSRSALQRASQRFSAAQCRAVSPHAAARSGFLSHAMPMLCRAGAPCSVSAPLNTPPHPQPGGSLSRHAMLCRSAAQQRRSMPRRSPAAPAARRFSLTPCRRSAEPERLAARITAFQRCSIPRRIRSPAVLSHAMPMLCRATAPHSVSAPLNAAPFPCAAARRLSLTPCRCSAEPERSSAAQRHAVPRAPHPQPGASLSRHADALPSRSAAAPPNAMPFPHRIRSPAVLSHAMPTLCRTAAQQRRPMPRRFPRRTRSPAVLSHAMPMRRHSR